MVGAIFSMSNDCVSLD